MTENIHTAINVVMDKVGYVQKERASGVPFTFAGEAALIQALRPEMVEHGIYMSVSKIKDVVRTEYQTKGGTVMQSTLITATMRFTHAPSDTYIEVEAVGEGSDASDKSANKAMTGLYKYGMRQTFMIETGDDPDKSQPEPSTGRHAKKAKVTAPPAPDTDGQGSANVTPQWLIDNQYTDKIPSAAAIINGLGVAGKPVNIAEPKIKEYRLWRISGASSTEAFENVLAGKPAPKE